jgi:hypothetical protein
MFRFHPEKKPSIHDILINYYYKLPVTSSWNENQLYLIKFEFNGGAWYKIGKLSGILLVK